MPSAAGKTFQQGYPNGLSIIASDMSFKDPQGTNDAVGPAAKEPPAYAEHQASDLVLTITRGTQTLYDANLDYNVAVASVAKVRSKDAANYAALSPVVLYLALPPGGVGVSQGQAHVGIPQNGPPNYEDLLNAVTTVLNADPKTKLPCCPMRPRPA